MLSLSMRNMILCKVGFKLIDVQSSSQIIVPGSQYVINIKFEMC